jgi:hypothetical protein
MPNAFFMPQQHPIAWTLIVGGLATAAIGVFWLFAPFMRWLGHLPGDIVIEPETVRFYFPLATCLLLSLVASALVFLFGRFLH